MKRRMLVALAMLAVPAYATAQDRAAPPPSRVTISPFLGYAFTYTQRGTVQLTDVKGSYTANYQRQVDGGVMPGVSVEVRAAGRFGFSATAAYNHRGNETLTTDFVDVAPLYSSGGKMWFLRGAVTMDLLDDDDMRIRPARGQLALGPAMVREIPDASTGRAAYNALAINGAATGELPLPWKGFSVRGTFEDYMSYLPKGDVGLQLSADMFQQTGRPYSAQLSSGPTHLYVIEAALAYRF